MPLTPTRAWTRIELVLVMGGAIFYYQSSIKLSGNEHRAVTAGLMTGNLLLLLFITNTLGL
ncbi:MAG: hypothetical protein HUU38_21140 [Anaerolineales bacterium]|nr:hypothetical protein [Anaerolineales bacterium]